MIKNESICKYYNDHRQNLQMNTIVGRKPGETTGGKVIESKEGVIKNIWCSHKRSPLKKNEKGTLPCKGDLKKCPIDPKLFNI